MAVEMGKLEEELSILKANIQRQEDIIEQKLRVVSQLLYSHGVVSIALFSSQIVRFRTVEWKWSI